MSSMKRASSGSEQDDRYAMIDDKKRKRMISNRESARRSRRKRDQHMKDINDQVLYFETKKNEMIHKFNKLKQLHMAIEAKNMIMSAQKQELAKRLECAEILTSYVGETGGVPMGAHQDPWLTGGVSMGAHQDPWLTSWQQQHQPPQSMPIMTSAGFFQF